MTQENKIKITTICFKLEIRSKEESTYVCAFDVMLMEEYLIFFSLSIVTISHHNNVLIFLVLILLLLFAQKLYAS